jgi:hypothetical protein
MDIGRVIMALIVVMLGWCCWALYQNYQDTRKHIWVLERQIMHLKEGRELPRAGYRYLYDAPAGYLYDSTKKDSILQYNPK